MEKTTEEGSLYYVPRMAAYYRVRDMVQFISDFDRFVTCLDSHSLSKIELELKGFKQKLEDTAIS